MRARLARTLPAMPILLYNLYSSDLEILLESTSCLLLSGTLEQHRVSDSVSFTLSAGSILVFTIAINVDTSAQVTPRG